MTSLAGAGVLAAILLATAAFGPVLLRRSAPALMRAPRTAVLMVSGGVVAWAVALVALGPLLAWSASGPALLAGSAGDVCQRCLASSNPFGEPFAGLMLPAAVPLAATGILGLVIAGGIAVELHRRWRASIATAAHLRAVAVTATVRGTRVLLVDDAAPLAWTLPRRHGGIVVSTGTLDALTNHELDAVLAHEQAHLSQRHHLLESIVAGVGRTLGRVPSVRAAISALPHYLEIAADARAQRVAGTPALARALVVLGSSRVRAQATAGVPGAPVLHAAGPQRIERLVGAAPRRGGTVFAWAAAVTSVASMLWAVAVMIPYGAAVASGCL